MSHHTTTTKLLAPAAAFAALAMAVLALLFAAPGAQAATHAAHVGTKAVHTVRVQSDWRGTTFYLSRGETKNAFAWGTWAAGVFVPASRVVQIIAAVLGMPATQSAANWIVDRGWCLAILRPRIAVVPFLPYPYRC